MHGGCRWQRLFGTSTSASIMMAIAIRCFSGVTLISRFMGPTWGPSGAKRTQVGPMLAPWTLLSGHISNSRNHIPNIFVMKYLNEKGIRVLKEISILILLMSEVSDLRSLAHPNVRSRIIWFDAAYVCWECSSVKKTRDTLIPLVYSHSYSTSNSEAKTYNNVNSMYCHKQ